MEKAGGCTSFNLSAVYHFRDFAFGFRKHCIKLNIFNLTNHKACSWATGAPFLASNAGAFCDVNGDKLYSGAAICSALPWLKAGNAC